MADIENLKKDLLENYYKHEMVYFEEKHGVSLSLLRRIRKELKIAPKRLSKERLSLVLPDIIKEYSEDFKSAKFLADKYDVDDGAVGRLLRKSNVRMRGTTFNKRKYSVDETFFEKINSPEKAYWFGFIAADGNITKATLSIKLSEKDKQHISDFIKRIKYTGPSFMFRENYRSVSIGRRKIVEDLKSLGLTENKTFKIDEHIFSKIPDIYLNAAIHGYFDGDGYASLSKGESKKRLTPYVIGVQIGIVGNLSFLLFIRDFFKKYGVEFVYPRHKKDSKQTYSIDYYVTGNNISNVTKALFSNPSSDFLPRKKNKLLQFEKEGRNMLWENY